MKLLVVEVNYHEIEECHISSWCRRIMKVGKFMKLVEHSDNMSWKVHEIVWNHDIDFALP